MSKLVLDSSALLALINEETGAEEVEALLGQAVLSTVNFAETVGKLALGGLEAREAAALIADIVPEIVPFTSEMALLAATLAPTTKALGLSLGDRACLATAMVLNAEAVTADKIWSKVKNGPKLRLIR